MDQAVTLANPPNVLPEIKATSMAAHREKMALVPRSMNSDGALSGDEGSSPNHVHIINRYSRDTAKSKESVRIRSNDNFYRQTSSSTN